MRKCEFKSHRIIFVRKKLPKGWYEMAKKVYSSIGTKRNPVPQSQPVPSRVKEMIKNDAGGYTFKIDPFKALERFLILGTENGTYYVGAKDLTVRSYTSILECIRLNPNRTVEMIVDISDSGRAPKNDPAIFALAVCASSENEWCRKYALDNLSKVCRIGTHLFMFIKIMKTFRGFGRAVRSAVAEWYLDRSPLSLALQLSKYQERDGFSHKDIIRLTHVDPKPGGGLKSNLIAWSIGKEFNENHLVGLAECHMKMRSAGSVDDVVRLINEYDAPRELVPTEYLRNPLIWRAMLPKMGAEALVRNLGNMTAYGVFDDWEGKSLQLVVDKLGDPEWIISNRLHPLKSLAAKLQYDQGQGDKGKNTWQVEKHISNALETAFYLGFRAVLPTNKRILYGIDVSGSMSYGGVPGVPGMTCAMGAAAMALVCASVEPNYEIGGFETRFVNLPIHAGMRLEDAMRITSNRNFGGTDAAVPFQWAISQKKDFDAFVLITDGESWAGNVHPYLALNAYRNTVRHDVKLVTMAMTATKSSIGDRQDESALDIVGWDTSVPQLISDFIGG
jgi:60 kDa SS-A/Ro ribonucleoprotein